MKNEIKINNYQQIDSIEKYIQDYFDKKIPINQLINNLEDLIYAIKDPPPSLVVDLIAEWSEIEIAYANSLYENRNFFNSQEKVRVKDALEKIIKLINEYKENCLVKSI
ncbi:hypothetical protein ACFLYH_02920 [Candidatus Dependentiae bacterium]